MKTTKSCTLTLLGFASIIIIAGCGGGSSPTVTGSAIMVSVSAGSTSVSAGGGASFTATVTGDPSGRGVTWTVSCSASQCGNVSPTATSSGLPTNYTAPSAPPPGDLTITVKATSVADSSKSGAATITFSAVTVSVFPTTAVLQAGSPPLSIGATVNNDEPSGPGVTWSISPPSGAGTLSNQSNGGVTYTPPPTPAASDLTVKVTATSVADISKSAAVTITVPSVTISVTPSTASVDATGNVPNIIAAVGNDSAHKGVSWSVSCSPAPCGSVLPTATLGGAATTYTAPTTPPPTDLQVTVTATSVADPPAQASMTITVKAISVVVTPQASNVQSGKMVPNIVAVVNDDPAKKGVTWAIQACGVTDCGSISSNATASGQAITYTAPASPPANDLPVTIVATSVSDTTQQGSITITVLAITVSVSPASGLIPVNATTQLNKTPFTATVSNDPSNKGVSWTLTQGTTPCSPGCGTVSLATTTSTPTVYSAPATVPASPTVTVTATSVADTTKLGTATITLAVGTVKIIPASLSFGTVRVGATSSPQMTTLTNAGGTTLNITGIAIIGTNPGDFLQTQTCLPSVGTGSSCGITVNFKPTFKGSRSADVSITDDSAGSPQLVDLSGKGCILQRNKCLTAASLRPAIQSALAGQRTATVPRTVGPSNVGTRVLELVNPTGADPYLASSAKRDLLVRFWYPASVSQGCKPAEYTTPRVWNYFSQLVGVSLPQVKTNSCLDAPITEGAHPIIVFTHGYTGTFTDYTFLFEDLASRGYVVASVDHTYEATAVDFPDGRFVKSVFGSHLGKTVRNDEQALSFAVSVRLSDLKFIVNELERLNASAESPFVGQLDISNIALAGHSLGGLTALLGLEQEPRFRAGIFIDGVAPDSLFSATKKPVLILAAGAEQWSDDECHLWGELRGPRFAVNLRASEHVTPSDAVWLAKGVIKTGPAGTEKTIAAIRDYVAAFLDVNLRGKPSDPLLTGPSADYPDADVTTQTQSLCGESQHDLQK